MSTIEKKGLAVLVKCLEQVGHVVLRNKRKTFDLSMNGTDVEVKAKSKPFGKLDFITYTETQHREIMNGPTFDTYVVCGVGTRNPEIYKVSSEHLKALSQ